MPENKEDSIKPLLDLFPKKSTELKELLLPLVGHIFSLNLPTVPLPLAVRKAFFWKPKTKYVKYFAQDLSPKSDESFDRSSRSEFEKNFNMTYFDCELQRDLDETFAIYLSQDVKDKLGQKPVGYVTWYSFGTSHAAISPLFTVFEDEIKSLESSLRQLTIWRMPRMEQDEYEIIQERFITTLYYAVCFTAMGKEPEANGFRAMLHDLWLRGNYPCGYNKKDELVILCSKKIMNIKEDIEQENKNNKEDTKGDLLCIIIQHLISMHIRGLIHFKEELVSAFHEIGTPLAEWPEHMKLIDETIKEIYQTNQWVFGNLSLLEVREFLGFE